MSFPYPSLAATHDSKPAFSVAERKSAKPARKMGYWRKSALLLLVFVSAGCDRQPSADTKEAGAQGAEKSAAAAAAPAAKLSAVKKHPVLATPREHRAVLALVDFQAFPKIEGATRQSASATIVGFSLPKKNQGDMRRVFAAMEAFLTAQGWKPAPGTKNPPWDDEGGEVFYMKDGAAMQVSAGISLASGPRSTGISHSHDINAGLFLIGEVDARSLPRLPGSTVVRESFSGTSFLAPADVMAVRKFQSEQLAARGWMEFRPRMPAGYEQTMEEKTREQSFVLNGGTIRYRLEAKGAQTEVSASCELMTRVLPIPPQPDLLKLQESPAMMSCFVTMKPEEILAWTQDKLGREGWTVTPQPATEEKAIVHRFQKSGMNPLLLECLAGEKSSLMRLREIQR